MHCLFLTNVNTKDYDGFIFGGTDSSTHFFTVVLFLDEKKEVFIFDPLQFSSTVPAVAKFLQLLFQYSNWLDSSGDDQPVFSKDDYTFMEFEQKSGLYLMSSQMTNLCPIKVTDITVAWI